MIATGRATKFYKFVANVDGASGYVMTLDDVGVPGGKVVIISTIKGRTGERYQETTVQPGGFFRAEVLPIGRPLKATTCHCPATAIARVSS